MVLEYDHRRIDKIFRQQSNDSESADQFYQLNAENSVAHQNSRNDCKRIKFRPSNIILPLSGPTVQSIEEAIVYIHIVVFEVGTMLLK